MNFEISSRYKGLMPNVGKGKDFRLIGYCDADYAGDRIDRKSTSRGYHYLGQNLISWSTKRQSSIALSTAETEYMSAASCCSQILGIKYQLEDYSIKEDQIPTYCDSAINLSKNPIQHSRAKHIEVRHHFIRDYVQRGTISIQFVQTDHQWVDVFTKPLTVDGFEEIRGNLNMVRIDVGPSEIVTYDSKYMLRLDDTQKCVK